jgi:hypothetical protein
VFAGASVFCFLLSLSTLLYLMLGAVVSLWAEGRLEKLPFPFGAVQSRFTVPLYIMLVFLSYVFSMTFVVGSLVTSDFCFDGPERHLMALAKGRLQGHVSLATTGLIQHYIKGMCDLQYLCIFSTITPFVAFHAIRWAGSNNVFLPGIFPSDISRLLVGIERMTDLNELSSNNIPYVHFAEVCGPGSSYQIMVENATHCAMMESIHLSGSLHATLLLYLQQYSS